MNHHLLYQLARERQANFLREAEMDRMARRANTGKPVVDRLRLSLGTALATAVIILLKFLG